MEPSTSSERASPSESHLGQEHSGWNPKHKIFLSHSGKQKNFVRQLCKDLEAEGYQPFFDERPFSLIYGEKFAPLIFEAAKQCLVGLVVLSEDFLKTMWPMLELVEFVKARKSCNPGLKLFPLFYKLSPEDLKDGCIEGRWKDAWAHIVTTRPDGVRYGDDRRNHLTLDLCVEAIRELRGATGLNYKRYISKVAYREAIVKAISLLFAPDLLDDTSDVIGKERLCKVLSGMFVDDTMEDSKFWGTQKLGLYGMGGLGKTTMCRALCMFYHERFYGRVFHAELGSRPPLELQKLVLMKLLHINKDVVKRIHTVYEGRKLLKDHMNRQPVFLAIDNIKSDHESQMEALAYLDAGFHVGSMIIITSRSLEVVENLFPSQPNALFCKGVVNLTEDEARLIFLKRAIPQLKIENLSTEEHLILNECLGQCLFRLDNGKKQYHPLALQALADYFHNCGEVKILEWKDHLEDPDKLQSSDASPNVFGVLGLQFKTFRFKEMILFVDLCLCYFPFERGRFFSWLVDIHEAKPSSLKYQLKSLKKSGIIDFHFNEDGELHVSIHDLYKEYAKWYVTDGEGSRWYVHNKMGVEFVPGNPISFGSLTYALKTISSAGAFELLRVLLEDVTCASFPFMKVQEWCNVVVLQIIWCPTLKVLDLKGLSCLRHLELRKLDDLESLHLAGSRLQSTWVSLRHVVLGGLPSLKRIPDFRSCPWLKTFELWGRAKSLPAPPRFVGCSQLEVLELAWEPRWRLKQLQLHTLTSLTVLGLRTRHSVSVPMRLRHLASSLSSVRKLPGLGACTQLQSLKLNGLPITSLRGLDKLTKLRELTVEGCGFLWDVPDVSGLAELKTLGVGDGVFSQFPGVQRLLQLEELCAVNCGRLTSLPDLDHLPHLARVDLQGCKAMKVPPRTPTGCELRT